MKYSLSAGEDADTGKTNQQSTDEINRERLQDGGGERLGKRKKDINEGKKRKGKAPLGSWKLGKKNADAQ